MKNERKRRDRLNIIAEVLKIAKDGSLKTQIMYNANLSFAQLNEYLSFLMRMNLLKIEKEEKKIVYKITAKGEKYLESYKEISSLVHTNEKRAVRANLGTLH